jgi:hypothetical protein
MVGHDGSQEALASVDAQDGHAKVGRSLQLGGQVLFLDGLTGTGKTMMAPILSTLRRVEVQRMEPIYEHLCALKHLGRIEEDAVSSLLRMYIDMATYNVMIARESNFRWKDLSGVFSNPGGWRYVVRLFQPDGDAVIGRINRIRPILQIVSHQVLGPTLFGGLGERAKVLEMVRHPLYLLEHWYSYMHRFGTDPREFTVWLDHKGEQLPWFAFGWEDEFLASNKMDRVIHSIEWLVRLTDRNFDALSEEHRRQVLVVPFERFVVDPWPYLRAIEEFLDTVSTRATGRQLRKQKVPRRLMAAGRDLPVYRKYNWRPPPRRGDEASELQKRWEFAEREASPEGLEALDRMSRDYEKRYTSPTVSSAALQSSPNKKLLDWAK